MTWEIDTRSLPMRVHAHLYAMNRYDWIAWGVIGTLGSGCFYGGWKLAKWGLSV